jgi:cellulose synthase/poly-beta-1,6-N-acetylglucosamine synthase-like glycosyltransferase
MADMAIQALFLAIFASTSVLTVVFLLRQIGMSLLVVDQPQKSPFSRAAIRDWPTVTVLAPAHNEEKVIGGCIERLLRLDYPAERLKILLVDDRSTDRTGEIIDGHVARSGGRLQVLHRRPGAQPGKPAALKDALAQVRSEIVVFFDADYLPDPPLLKTLVAPFLDPQVGATMGRVVPYNTEANLLTRLLDLERRGGYTVDQAGRARLEWLPQFGGTVGGVRMAALHEVGGWAADTLAEDTDLTYRLFLEGWTVEYVDDAMCHEESPEVWTARFRQVRRWACGHDQCLFRYFLPVLASRRHPLARRLDAALVLLFFLFPPLALANLVAALIYPTLYPYPPFNFALVSVAPFIVSFGNFAPYFQIIAAVLRDRQPRAAAMLPLLFISSAISMLAACSGLVLAVRGILLNRAVGWDKTIRYRRSAHA